MSERRYEVETYESTPGNVVRFAIVDTATGHWLCNCPCIEDADKIAAALNAAEQAGRERELLAKMAMVLKRCEDAVADTVDEHSHSDEGGLTLRLLHDCLDDFAALQTEEHDG